MYCSLEIDQLKRITHKKTDSQKWNASFEWNVSSLDRETEPLKVVVWAVNEQGKEEFVGDTTVFMAEMLSPQNGPKWYLLTPAPGEIQLSFSSFSPEKE